MIIESCESREQRVLDARGHLLILGGPGSGKTTIALKKAVRRIGDGLLGGQFVLFLSFSRAAVTRIAEASKSEVAKQDRDRISIHTIHSFCWELLKGHGYLLGHPGRIELLAPHDERALSGGIERNDPGWADWESERERLFRTDGKIAFDLFAPKAAELLSRSKLLLDLVASRFPLVIVDEAQDTGLDAWSCIETLAPKCQIMCLADQAQQIFDYLPGVGPERVSAIRATLNPLEVDLGGDNHRSPGSEILPFANDVLAASPRAAPYAGVSKLIYNPRGNLSQPLRKALGKLAREVKARTGQWPDSVAILAPSGPSVARVSRALNEGDKPVRHKVLFDQAEALLSSRLAAFLLEPKVPAQRDADVVVCLTLLAAVKRATGTATAMTQSNKLQQWALGVRSGKHPASATVRALVSLLDAAAKLEFAGDPARDWLEVKRLLVESNHEGLTQVANHLDYLVAFSRGKRIASALSTTWMAEGAYNRARIAVDSALSDEQIIGGVDDLTGIHVMTIHKSKAKQFAGVIIVREGRRTREGWESSLVWRDDVAPHHRSRKILRVAITRARTQVLVLEPAYPACAILSAFRL